MFGKMKEIKLSKTGKNKGKFVALVDDEDFEYLNQFKWCVSQNVIHHYAIRVIYNPCKKILWMHRVIMNTPDGMETDHKDRNGLNNQKSNLRVCTRLQNVRNSIGHSNSGYKGVCQQGKNQIVAHINIRTKTSKRKIYLGSFKTIIDAACAYDEATKKYFGEYGYLNFK